MICVVDASVAVKWFADGDWALREDDIEPALEILKASTRGTGLLPATPFFGRSGGSGDAPEARPGTTIH